MKRMIAIAAVSMMMGAGLSAWAAGAFPKHPNLGKAHEHLVQAAEKITAAQKANEFDMEGHAAKAKDLIAQAQTELEEAAKAANKK